MTDIKDVVEFAIAKNMPCDLSKYKQVKEQGAIFRQQADPYGPLKSRRRQQAAATACNWCLVL
jgi:hypothetical protein